MAKIVARSASDDFKRKLPEWTEKTDQAVTEGWPRFSRKFAVNRLCFFKDLYGANRKFVATPQASIPKKSEVCCPHGAAHSRPSRRHGLIRLIRSYRAFSA